MRSSQRLIPTLCAVLLALGAATALQAQGRTASYDRIDAHYTIQPDGRVRVRERQVVDFRGGPFRTGFARLGTRGARDIQVLGVRQLQPDRDYRPGREEAYTYAVER